MTHPITAGLKFAFPHMTPVSEAPEITSDAMFSEEWTKRYSAVVFFDKKPQSYWEVQNPYLLKWQYERRMSPIRRAPNKLIEQVDSKKKGGKGGGYEPNF